MNESELIESQELRNKCIEHYEILENVKALLLIKGTDTATLKQVANFYEVSEKTINSLVMNNRSEITEDGLMNLTGKETKAFLGNLSNEFANFRGYFTYDDMKFNNRNNLLFPRRAILRVGMLLRDSEIAKEIRTQLLNIEEKTSEEAKTADISEEQKLMLSIGMAYASGNIDAILKATTEYNAFQNRHIKELQENNEQLTSDNLALTGEILSWSDRKKLNAGVRKLASVKHVQFGSVWSELYKQLHYKYGINLKARNGGQRPYIDNVKESEWNMVIKSFAAICESYDQSPTDMLQQKVTIS